ncbi:MAG: LD-carboxypeptidase [Clostridiales bacterium]|nr:LD-carboxypeptidase [Clostridiales bacterium]
MLKQGDRVGIVACSNALGETEKDQLDELIAVLGKIGLTPELSPYLFRRRGVFGGTGAQRAGALNAMIRDDAVKAIFDVSGGDIANELLDEIDFDALAGRPKPFFGYSDLTTVLNAIYEKTRVPSYLYQVRCLVRENGRIQTAAFENSILHGKNDLFDARWSFVRGSSAEGVVVGGNIRCLLRLAGTQYLLDMRGKLLFLESYGGGAAQMTAYFSQLGQIGAFDRIKGLLLGTFTKMEESAEKPDIVELALSMTRHCDFPIAKTHDIGHANTSKCLTIGTRQSFLQSV